MKKIRINEDTEVITDYNKNKKFVNLVEIKTKKVKTKTIHDDTSDDSSDYFSYSININNYLILLLLLVIVVGIILL